MVLNLIFTNQNKKITQLNITDIFDSDEQISYQAMALTRVKNAMLISNTPYMISEISIFIGVKKHLVKYRDYQNHIYST